MTPNQPSQLLLSMTKSYIPPLSEWLQAIDACYRNAVIIGVHGLKRLAGARILNIYLTPLYQTKLTTNAAWLGKTAQFSWRALETDILVVGDDALFSWDQAVSPIIGAILMPTVNMTFGTPAAVSELFIGFTDDDLLTVASTASGLLLNSCYVEIAPISIPGALENPTNVISPPALIVWT